MGTPGPPHRHEFEDGSFVEISVTEVPRSAQYPAGIKYRFQYVSADEEPLLRYDNAHGTHEQHRHSADSPDPVEFNGVEELLQQFFAEVETMREA